jgi:hypothetical protein
MDTPAQSGECRIKYFEMLYDHTLGHDGVVMWTGAEILNWDRAAGRRCPSTDSRVMHRGRPDAKTTGDSIGSTGSSGGSAESPEGRRARRTLVHGLSRRGTRAARGGGERGAELHGHCRQAQHHRGLAQLVSFLTARPDGGLLAQSRRAPGAGRLYSEPAPVALRLAERPGIEPMLALRRLTLDVEKPLRYQRLQPDYESGFNVRRASCDWWAPAASA